MPADFQIQTLLRLSTQDQMFLAMMAGWMSRQQQAVIEYLLQENRILKEQFDSTGRKLRLDNRQRRELAKRGKAMSWSDLQSYATLVPPETILAWHRKLVALKYTASYHVFFVMKLAQRQVEIVQISCQLDGQVMTQLARNMTDGFDGYLKGMRFFVCDHDPLYTAAFRQVLKDAGIKVIQTRIGCPQQNGYAESFVATVQRECLDHLILFGEKSLRRAVKEFVEHFHQERNHQGLDNQIPFPKQPRGSMNTGLIVKSGRLGGLLKYYHRDTEPLTKEESRTAA